MKKYSLLLAFLTISLACTQALAQPTEEVVINTIQVTESIYMLESKGSGNIGVSVGKDGILIVDDKFEPLAEKIRESLAELGGGKLKFILNTHWHGDHTGGNKVFGPESVIVAHDNVRKRLSTEQRVKFFNMVSEPHPSEALPDITFDDSLSIHFNNEKIKVIHFGGGHTDGDSVVFFTKSNVVHMGDHFFNGTYPFVDLDSGGDVQGFMDNIVELLTLIPQDAKIIPGHGPLANYEDLKMYHAMLLETTSLVKQAIKGGKDLIEIKEKGFPQELVNKWGHGFLNTEKWIEIIYNSYSR